ncbi:MAG: TerC family protein [Planctomycetota bacterium]
MALESLAELIPPTLAVLEEAAPAVAEGEGGPTPFFSPKGLIALVTLSALEIVLGIDNIVFIAIVTGKLPEHQRAKARSIGLLLAMGMRIALLFAIAWVLSLSEPLFSIGANEISIKDLILLLGGFFLIGKSVWEIRHLVTPHAGHAAGESKRGMSLSTAIVQILILDAVFSIDSVITAAGMTDNILIMITAVMISIGVMLAFAGPVSRFVERHPEVKVLALAFLILIGVLLLAEGWGEHLDRNYVYVAMGFALTVDLLQMRQVGVSKASAAGGATDAE